MANKKTTVEIDGDASGYQDAMGTVVKSTKNSEKAIVAASAAAAVALTAVAAVTAKAVLDFASFENEILGVKTLLDEASFGAKGLEKGFNNLKKETLDLATKSSSSMTELNKALFDTVSAGVDASEAINVLTTANKLAIAGITSVSVATDGLTSALNAYQKQASDADKVAAQFFTAQKFGKCFAKGTEILLHSGIAKKVEDIIIGDKLMGDDNKPRNVLALGRGKEMMYRLTMRDGSSYTVNESHILSLKISSHFKTDYYKDKKTKRFVEEKITNVSVRDYLKKSNDWKARNLGYKTSIELKSNKTPIDPYFLGLWLGDGHTDQPRITTMDKEIVRYIKSICKKNNWNLKKYIQKDNKSSIYSMTKDRSCQGKGSFTELLRKNNLMGNKHIPKDFMINSLENRLLLLAGLIDTDGSFCKDRNNAYEFSNKNKSIIKDFTWIARSCGFYCKSYKKIVEGTTYYRVYISGDVHKIPCKIKRKKCKKSNNAKRNVLAQSFKIEKLKIDDYYGFEIDGNRLFVLNDFNVTHNTTVEELSNGFGLVGASANAMGVSLEELLGSVAAVTTAGVKTSSAYTGLKAVLANISKPTREASDEAKRLGVTFDAAALRSKGLERFLGDLTKAQGFTKDSVTELFGSVEAQNIIFSLTGAQAKDFSRNIKELSDEQKLATTFSNAFTIQNESLQNSFKRLSNTANVISIKIGEALAPAIAEVTENVGKAVEAFAKLDDESFSLIATFLKWSGIILSVIAGAGTLAIVAVKLSAAIGLISAAFIPATISASAFWIALTGPIGLAVAGVAAVTAGVVALNVALSETPTDSLDETTRKLEKLKKVLEENKKIARDTGKDPSQSIAVQQIQARIDKLEELRKKQIETSEDFGTGKLLLRPEMDGFKVPDIAGLDGQVIPLRPEMAKGEDPAEKTKKDEEEKTEAVEEGTQKRIDAATRENEALVALREARNAGATEEELKVQQKKQSIEESFAKARLIADKTEKALALKNLQLKHEKDLTEIQNFEDSKLERAEENAERERIFEEELQALSAEQKALLTEKDIEDLQTKIMTEEEMKSASTKKELLNHIKAREQFLKDEEKFGERAAKLKKFFGSEEVQNASNVFGQLEVLQRSNSSKMRAVGKAAAHINAAIATSEGAIKAYTSLAGIPVAGPALGATAAGLLVAFGVEQQANIQAAANGGVIRNLNGGSNLRDSQLSFTRPGELVTPVENFDQVIGSTRALKEAQKLGGGLGGGGELMIGFQDENAADVLTLQDNENDSLGISRRIA